MKRLIFALFFILILAALALWGDRILSRALDAKLAPLLTQELGLPVRLAPIQARVLNLRANSAKLIMGDPNDPAVVATDVQVSLAWSDLLNREIRLVTASAGDLMVRVSKWPSSGDPLPDDYQFLEQWLPKRLQVETGRYVTESGTNYPLRKFRWQRKFNGGADLEWTEDRAGGEVSVSTGLESLNDLLNLSPIALQLTTRVTDKQDSQISTHVALKPQQPSGYALQATVESAGMQAHVIATNESPWSLPSHSKTSIASLEPDKLRRIISSYTTSPDTATDATSQLVETLPVLALPDHQGDVKIDEIRVGDETVTDNAFSFITSAHGLQVSSITSKGPSGVLQGQFDIQSASDGWQLNLDAKMQTRQADESIAAQYLEAEWLWQSGHAKLDGAGQTWGALLDSLEGDITLDGFYRGEVNTPVTISARLDSRPGEIALDDMLIELGHGRISGTATFSGTERRKLTLDIKGENLDLGFMFTDPDKAPLPGLSIPEYLAILPGIEVSAALSVMDVKMPGLNLTQADISLERTQKLGHLVMQAKGTTGGSLALTLDAYEQPDNPHNVILSATIKELDIPQLFQQTDIIFDSRSSGTLTFEGHGKDMEEVFKSMQGKAQLTTHFRSDKNWQRTTKAEEKLQFAGNATLIITGDQILGVEISNLDIDSIQQAITGTLSMAGERTPWLIADLQANKLDVAGLMALMPDSTEQADEHDILKSLRDIGAVKVSLNARSLILEEVPLLNMQLEVSSSPGVFTLEKLDFTAEDSRLKSQGRIQWQGDRAELEISASADKYDLDRFLIQDPNTPHVPVSGAFRIVSSGKKLKELLANVTGHINFEASDKTVTSPRLRRKLSMQVVRVADGVHAEISSLQLGKSELSGELRYRRTAPPQLDIEITGGSFSLLPWERILDQTSDHDTSKSAENSVAGAAKASADFVGNILATPVKLFSGPGEADPGKKYFSSQPLRFATLRKNNVNVKGQMASLTSSVGELKDLSFTGTLLNGQLSAKVTSGGLNKGTAEAEVAVNANAAPPSVHLSTTFNGVYGAPGKTSYPRSGFASLTSVGQTQAELAANLNGLVYLELGRGPFDYQNSSLLSAEISTTMFRALIPGIENEKPELECGVTTALFKDGMGATPFGFAARTNKANLIGRIEVDLHKEMLRVGFDSRSREGVGISVSSVFSNTVQVKGPLTDPKIVPHTTGILWRGWAAFMTAGLSVVGESVFKRALASENPCKSLKKDIKKELCPKNQLAASSPLMCGNG